MKDLIIIKTEVHDQVLRARNMETLLDNSSFVETWNVSTEEERECIYKLIQSMDHIAISHWAKTHHSLDLSERNSRNLKAMAQCLQIPNWSRKTKTELIESIKQSEKQMEQSKQDYFDKIRHMIEKMQHLITEAGITPAYYWIPESVHIEKLSIDCVQEAYFWVKEIYTKEYDEAQQIYGSQSPEQWERYKLWDGFQTHRECILLNRALQNLRVKFQTRKRPKLFKQTVIKQELKKLEKRKNDKRNVNT